MSQVLVGSSRSSARSRPLVCPKWDGTTSLATRTLPLPLEKRFALCTTPTERGSAHQYSLCHCSLISYAVFCLKKKNRLMLGVRYYWISALLSSMIDSDCDADTETLF